MMSIQCNIVLNYAFNKSNLTEGSIMQENGINLFWNWERKLPNLFIVEEVPEITVTKGYFCDKCEDTFFWGFFFLR